MTSRANQNWPDEVTYELTAECGAEHAAVSSPCDDCSLGLYHRVGEIVESAERTVSELINLVEEVMQ